MLINVGSKFLKPGGDLHLVLPPQEIDPARTAEIVDLDDEIQCAANGSHAEQTAEV
jgi:tRNA1(Val) A37 N6-methylase TrmN6